MSAPSSFGTGFDPDRYRIDFKANGKRTLTDTENTIHFEGATHRDCGGSLIRADGKYSEALKCNDCGELVDPKRLTLTDDDEQWYNGEGNGATKSAPRVSPPKSAPSGDTEAALETLRSLLGGNAKIDPDDVRRIAETVFAESLEKAKASGAFTTVIEIKRGDSPVVKIEGRTHAMFEAILKRTSYVRSNGSRFNVALVGPKGCGKTHIVHQIATALSLPYGALSCGGGTTDGEIIGRVIPNLTDGSTVLQESLFLKMYRDGGVFLFDELDALNPTTALRLNMALENGSMFDALGNKIMRHPNAHFFGCLNTWGHGANREYCGREMQDAALMDRFTGGMFDFGYDDGLESALCPDAGLLAKLWSIRAKASSLKLQRRGISSRGILAAYELVAGCGLTHAEAILQVTADWSAADRASCGI